MKPAKHLDKKNQPARAGSELTPASTNAYNSSVFPEGSGSDILSPITKFTLQDPTESTLIGSTANKDGSILVDGVCSMSSVAFERTLCSSS